MTTMNRFYDGWLTSARDKAIACDLTWAPEYCPTTGKVVRAERWNLTELVGLTPPPTLWLSSFAHVEGDRVTLQAVAAEREEELSCPTVMSLEWQEFLQASLIYVLLMKRNKLSQAMAYYRAIRTLSLCAPGKEPWAIQATDVQRAYNVALHTGASGKLALNLKMVVVSLLDAEHLTDHAPLGRYAQPYGDEKSRKAEHVVRSQRRRESSNHNVHHKRGRLADRKSAERLPEMRAFWELIRIVFTETPKSFTDRIRFGVLKLQIANGLRIGENMLIPENWCRRRDYFDASGRPASASGGISHSLSLRYYGLKQDDEDVGSEIRLVERFQEVPRLYESLVQQTMDEVLTCTAPLRNRLRAQVETGRLLPEYAVDDLVSAVDMFRHVGGSIRITNEPILKESIDRYRVNHSVEVLQEIRQQQDRSALKLPVQPVYRYWHNQPEGPPPRDALGSPLIGSIDYKSAYFRVGEVEDFIRRCIPTKLPDTGSFVGPGGVPIYIHQMAFLHPSRSLIEGRDGGLIDIENYLSVGRLPASDVQLQLSNPKAGLFARYGETEEDRELTLVSHSSRHLQHGELFRLGVANTIITKRYNRTATSQSRTYDHRTLAEELKAIELPPLAREIVPERAHSTLRLIVAGKVRGPIVDEFLEIQRTLGDQVAFEYLAAEADGLHVTPYGFCLSSFTVDPCPKHLQCFNGCRHLGRTNNPEEQENLILLQERTRAVLSKAEASPPGSVGRKNQIAHAEAILANVAVALKTPPGALAFPEGVDLSEAIGKPRTIIDAALASGEQSK